ncbi:MAG: replicative helicase, partial [Chloroflexota bacterium]|nr:replicative helicase [Chloroflexota bacterium]
MITSTPPVGRTLPHDHEAEVSVLGALMLDPNAVAMVRDRLVPEDFYSERHGHIYRASLILADQGQPIDPLMLRSQLERNGALSQSGGVEYLAELSASVFTAASIQHWADIVYERALKRRLITAGGDLATLGFDESLSATEAVDRAEQRVYGLADQRRVTEATHVAPVLKDTWTQLETLLGKRQFVTGVPTNFSELD